MGPNYAEMEAARTLRLDREYAEHEHEVREEVLNEYIPTWDELVSMTGESDFSSETSKEQAIQSVWNALNPATRKTIRQSEIDWRVEQWQ